MLSVILEFGSLSLSVADFKTRDLVLCDYWRRSIYRILVPHTRWISFDVRLFVVKIALVFEKTEMKEAEDGPLEKQTLKQFRSSGYGKRTSNPLSTLAPLFIAHNGKLPLQGYAPLRLEVR